MYAAGRTHPIRRTSARRGRSSSNYVLSILNSTINMVPKIPAIQLPTVQVIDSYSNPMTNAQSLS